MGKDANLRQRVFTVFQHFVSSIFSHYSVLFCERCQAWFGRLAAARGFGNGTFMFAMFEFWSGSSYVRADALEGLVVEIVIFAMIAGFLGLRLYMVLGKRTGAEPPLRRPEEAKLGDSPAPVAIAERKEKPAAAVTADTPVEPGAVPGLRAIASADPGFNGDVFIAGAQSAYRMVLEAFWRGDREALATLADEDVQAAFGEAISDREEAGQTLDNRLVRVDKAVIAQAALDGRIARIMVRFDADIAAVTRDADGKVVAGSLTDAVPTHDVWTFERDVKSRDPNWLLVDTDEAQ